jgi:hypothetical protein
MRTFSQWTGAVITSLFPKREVDGVRVTFTDIAVDKEECLARIHRAIELTRNTGFHYASLIKRLRSIVVWPGNRTFAVGAREIHIASEDLLGINDLALASVLVHEAVHLRINARGIKYKPAYRERIERVCIAEQARFLRCFPGDGEEMAREAEACLAVSWWTHEAREATLDDMLEKHQLPRWLKVILPRS